MDGTPCGDKQRRHILRQHCLNRYVLACDRMPKTHLGTVERMAVYFFARAAVEVISQQRMAEVRHVTADLMGLAGLEPQTEKRIFFIRINNRIMCDGRRTFRCDMANDLGILMQADGSADGAVLRHFAVYGGKVGFVDTVFQSVNGEAVLCDHHQARGVSVQTVQRVSV